MCVRWWCSRRACISNASNETHTNTHTHKEINFETCKFKLRYLKPNLINNTIEYTVVDEDARRKQTGVKEGER